MFIGRTSSIALLLAATCSLNCLFLYAWEHPGPRSRAHWSTRWATNHLVALTTTVATLSLLLILISSSYQIPVLRYSLSRSLAEQHQPFLRTLDSVMNVCESDDARGEERKGRKEESERGGERDG